MGIGAIVNANNAILPEDVRDVTLNCRYVYVPPFELPDKERKFGNLTLTYASQVHVCLARDRPRDGRLRDRRLRGRRRLRHAHPPADRRGAGARRDRAGARRRDARDLRLRRGGQPADAQLLRLPRAARARHAAAEDAAISSRRRRSRRSARRAWARAAARASTPCARRSRTRSRSRGKPTCGAAAIRTTRCGSTCASRSALVEVESDVKVEGTRSFAAPRETVWEVLNSPERMAKLMPGVETFDVQDDRALAREREDPARPRRRCA